MSNSRKIKVATFTGYSTEQLTECPLCGGRKWKSLLEYSYYTDRNRLRVGLQKCETCGLLFVNPRPSMVALMGHFEKASYTRPDPDWRTAQVPARERLFRRVISLVQHLGPSQGLWLDVGAGYGQLLEMARTVGYNVLGTEALGRLCRELQERHIPCYHTVSLKSPTDLRDIAVITMIDSLYSFLDPLEELAEAHRILKSDGVLVCRVSNRALVVRTLAHIGHNQKVRMVLERLIGDGLFNFSTKTLKMMLEKAGFSSIYFDYRGAHQKQAPEVWDKLLQIWAAAIGPTPLGELGLTVGVIGVARKR